MFLLALIMFEMLEDASNIFTTGSTRRLHASDADTESNWVERLGTPIITTRSAPACHPAHAVNS